MGALFLPFNAPKLISPMPSDSPHSKLSWFYSFGAVAWLHLYLFSQKLLGLLCIFTFTYWYFFFVVVPIFSRKKSEKPQLYPIQARYSMQSPPLGY
jgi:hypothetical protein